MYEPNKIKQKLARKRVDGISALPDYWSLKSFCHQGIYLAHELSCPSPHLFLVCIFESAFYYTFQSSGVLVKGGAAYPLAELIT